MSVLYFDIAAIPDFELGTRLYELHDLSQEDVSRVMFTKSRENSSNPGELSQHMLQVAAMSMLIHDDNEIKIRSTGTPGSTEADLLQTLQQLISEHQPSVVTWNGKRSILPLLNFRYLSHALRAPLLTNSIDLSTELSGATGQSADSLNEVAVLCGFPAIKPMTSEEVLDAYLEGNIQFVQNRLELNVIISWLLNQRWQLVRGSIEQPSYEIEYQQLKETLLQQNKPHLTEFVESLN